jgi:hypothetical protein
MKTMGLGRGDRTTTTSATAGAADFRANEHCFASFANCQTEVAHQRAAAVDVQRFDRLGAKTGCLQRDRVRPGGDRSDVVAPFGIGADRHGETGRVVARRIAAP